MKGMKGTLLTFTFHLTVLRQGPMYHVYGLYLHKKVGSSLGFFHVS